MTNWAWSFTKKQVCNVQALGKWRLSRMVNNWPDIGLQGQGTLAGEERLVFDKTVAIYIYTMKVPLSIQKTHISQKAITQNPHKTIRNACIQETMTTQKQPKTHISKKAWPHQKLTFLRKHGHSWNEQFSILLLLKIFCLFDQTSNLNAAIHKLPNLIATLR